MALLSVTQIARNSAVVVTLTAAAGGGDSFPNTGAEFVEILNGSGASITVSATQVAVVDSGTPGTKAVVVTAGSRVMFGPFPPSIYNDTLGRVNLTYSGVTSLSLNPFRLNPALP